MDVGVEYPMIKFEEIEQILEIMREHQLVEFECERDGLRIRLRKGSDDRPVVVESESEIKGTQNYVTDQAPEAGPELVVIKSPVVGTFYRSSVPGAPPFVEIGDTVKKGQSLCIIEAMKLMNEIDADQDGEIVSILAENGQPIQYGETLFTILPS